MSLALATISPALMAQSSAAPAAAASAPANPEDKIPDWVKKQADNPIKWIIKQDNKTKTKPAAVAEEKAPKRPAATTAKKAKPEDEAPALAAPVINTRSNTVATKPADAPAIATPAAIAPPAVADAPATNAKPAVTEPPAATVATLSPPPEAAPLKSAKAALEEMVPISQAQPALSREVIQAGIRQGRVLVKFMVNPDGSVSDVAIAESSDKLLNKSVVAAVKQWIYKPINQQQPNTAEIAFKLE